MLNNDTNTNAGLPGDDSATGGWVKQRHGAVLKALEGLTVAQARFVLDIAIEDFTANAVIPSN